MLESAVGLVRLPGLVNRDTASSPCIFTVDPSRPALTHRRQRIGDSLKEFEFLVSIILVCGPGEIQVSENPLFGPGAPGR